jgi:hypothetical protein
LAVGDFPALLRHKAPREAFHGVVAAEGGHLQVAILGQWHLARDFCKELLIYLVATLEDSGAVGGQFLLE